MDQTKFRDLIDLVFNSVKGMIESNSMPWTRPEKCSYFMNLVPEKGVDRVNEENTKFEFTISTGTNGEKLKYVFNVEISKISRIKGFWKKVDDSRYVSRIRIRENTNWSSSEIEAYYIDTDNEKHNNKPSTRDIQSKMFNLLMETHVSKETEKENGKINGFISEIKKAADKAVIRDEKIDNILN
jgi:hypothetical protein